MRPVTEAEFDPLIAEAALPVLVDFWAPWCGPCRSSMQALAEIENAMSGRLEAVKIDVDENAPLARRLGIHSVPTLMLFRAGHAVASMVGVPSKEAVLRWLETHAFTTAAPSRERGVDSASGEALAAWSNSRLA